MVLYVGFVLVSVGSFVIFVSHNISKQTPEGPPGQLDIHLGRHVIKFLVGGDLIWFPLFLFLIQLVVPVFQHISGED